MRALLADFKRFLAKGNLVTVAVGLVMALVFTALVKAFINDLVTPIIAMIFGKQNFEDLSFTINASHFLYGDFLNAVITFLTTAVAVFLFVVEPYQAYMARRTEEDPTIKDCPECTSQIPAAARRCPQCTAQLTTAPAVS
jgi:large conductance mechanosensitive channel